MPWVEVDDATIERWWEIEEGAIIVIDEAQRFFRPRGSSVGGMPEKFSRFETHRKSGHDVVLITQHPSFLDAHVRKLVEWHIHVFRGWGLAETTRYQWQECQNPNDRRIRKECQMQKVVRFPKEAFSMYKSANVHNVKRELPWKRIGLVVLLLTIMATSFTFFLRSWNTDKPKSSVPSASADSLASAAARTLAPGVHDRVMTAQELAVALTPVIPAIPSSAPLYQPKWLEVADVPLVSGCVASSDECVCYTQQGTRLDVQESFCRAQIARPAFDHTRARQPAQPAVVSQASGSAQDVVSSSPSSPGPAARDVRDRRRDRDRVVLPGPRGA